MIVNTKYFFILIALILIGTSITCTFAEDSTLNGTDIGTPTPKQEIYDTNINVLVNNIPNTPVEDNVIISGELTYNDGKVITDSELNIIADGISYGDKENTKYLETTVKTDKSGHFKYEYKTNTGGSLNITVKYPESSASTNTSTYVIPKSTIVTMNTSKQIDIGESFNITGRLTDCDGRVLRYTSVGVLFRGTAYGEFDYKNYSKEYVRTDEDGYYSIELVPALAGRFDISVYYPGYHYYRFNRTDKSVLVRPMKTIVTVDEIPAVFEGDNVTITGKLTDGEKNPLRYTSVGVLRNYEKVYTRTDENGYYNYTFTNDGLIDNSVTVYYPGFHNYAFSRTDVIYTVMFKEPQIILNTIPKIYKGSSVIIEGSVLSYDKKDLNDILVKVTVETFNHDNDKWTLVDTQTCEVLTKNGLFTANWYDSIKEDYSKYFTPKSEGLCVVTAECDIESNNYGDSVDFLVMEPKDDIIITSIEQQEQNIFISGYVTLSENNQQYFNSENYPIEAIMLPENPSFPEQKRVYAYKEYVDDFCFAIRDIELFLHNDEFNINYVTINYKLTNGKNITSQVITLYTETINNETKLVDYEIN